MDLIERYLHAVKEHLPAAQQQDVIEELGDDLRSRIEERESALGRPLVEDEVVAILKQLGRPMILAGTIPSASAADRTGDAALLLADAEDRPRHRAARPHRRGLGDGSRAAVRSPRASAACSAFR